MTLPAIERDLPQRRPAVGITGLILAGGRGARMGGQDKGLVMLADQPLVAHVAARLRPQVNTLLVSANRNVAAYTQYGQVVGDISGDFEGPLAGLEAGLTACTTDWLLSLPCDALGAPPSLASQLVDATADAGTLAAYVTLGDDALYPCCLLHRSLLASLSAWLQQPDRAVRHWLTAERAVAVPIRGWTTPFFNLNTPDDLARAATSMRAPSGG